MKTCPFCAEEIKDAAIVCRHCGRDLPASAARAASAASAPDALRSPVCPASAWVSWSITWSHGWRFFVVFMGLAVVFAVYYGVLVGLLGQPGPRSPAVTAAAYFFTFLMFAVFALASWAPMHWILRRGTEKYRILVLRKR